MKRIAWGMLVVSLIAIAGCAPSDSGSGEAADSSAADSTVAPAGDVTFASAIEPIIAAKCANCHVDETKGGLSLASLDATLAGGKKGSDVVPGDAEGSLLYQMVAGLAEKRMPPKGDPLSDDQIATIKTWIESGAH